MGEDAQQGKVISVLEVLSLVRPRIAMFTGEATLRSLNAFIKGFEMACAACGAIVDYEALDLGKFTEWLERREHLMKSGMGWSQIIVERVGADDIRAVDGFFLLLDEYLKEKHGT